MEKFEVSKKVRIGALIPVSAMSSGGFRTTHFKFNTNEHRKHKTSRKN